MHIPLYYALLRLFRGLRFGWKDPEFKALLVFVAVLLLTGTVFYSEVEHWRLLDSFYFSVTTLATVGFGDFAPKTDLGKIFTVIYIIIGVGTLLSFVTLLSEHSQKDDPLQNFIEEHQNKNPKSHES